MPASHESALAALARRSRLRSLTAAAGRDFTSNDYLGLADSPELRDAVQKAIERGVPVGAGGSRLLRGNHDEHVALETEAARFFAAGSALFFGSGFAANSAMFSTLPARGDLVLYDGLIHASVHEGLKLTKAQAQAFVHNDADHADRQATAWRRSGATGHIWIATESLFSMDGDRAPLDALAALANRHDATLIIDEAHATGVLGPGGRGLGAHLEGRDNVISLHTCGKALGVSGALVLAPKPIREFLVNRARAFIFGTAPSPLMAAAVRAALRIVSSEPERRDRLHRRVQLAGSLIRSELGISPTGTAIQPILCGSDQSAVAFANEMTMRGFDVRAVRPPTVPENTARLRLTITLNVDDADVADLVQALRDTREKLAA